MNKKILFGVVGLIAIILLIVFIKNKLYNDNLDSELQSLKERVCSIKEGDAEEYVVANLEEHVPGKYVAELIKGNQNTPEERRNIKEYRATVPSHFKGFFGGDVLFQGTIFVKDGVVSEDPKCSVLYVH